MDYTKTWNQGRNRLELELFKGILLAGGLWIYKKEVFPFSTSHNGYNIKCYLIIPIIGAIGLTLSFKYSIEKRYKNVARNQAASVAANKYYKP